MLLCFLVSNLLKAMLDGGLLNDQQTEKITGTVKEMLDNLSDFEPRRWFDNYARKHGMRKKKPVLPRSRRQREARRKSCWW